jgi:hypothetical protein
LRTPELEIGVSGGEFRHRTVDVVEATIGLGDPLRLLVQL